MGLSENGESQIHWLPIIFPSYVPSNGHGGGIVTMELEASSSIRRMMVGHVASD